MTRILALESSGSAGSVAALESQALLGHAALDPALRSTRSLAPGIRQLLADVGWRPRDVQLVAVTAGPGSFTGLRVGVTTAKMFAYAAGAEVLGVNTLEVLAEQAPPGAGMVKAVIDAQRQELFAAAFTIDAEGRRMLVPPVIVPIGDWLKDLSPGDVVIGPVLAKLRERLPPDIAAAPESSWTPLASTVGLVAARRYAAGQREDLWRLAPLYLRRSAAEEKAALRTPPASS